MWTGLNEETGDDWWEVEALLDLSFAPGREALSSYRLRDGVAPVAGLCLVARERWHHRWRDPGLAGAGGARWMRCCWGPVAVHPTRQGEGAWRDPDTGMSGACLRCWTMPG